MNIKNFYILKTSLSCLACENTQEQISLVKKETENIKVSFSSLEGSFEEILKKNHLQLLSLMALAISNDNRNKHLNLDYEKLVEDFREKYKITNID